MENASKALLMAAGVLIGVLILSLAVFLFINFGQQAKQIHGQITANQLTQFNAQFNLYEGRKEKDVTIYQIVTMANLAYENNKKEKYDKAYQVTVWLKDKELTSEKLDYQKLLEKYNKGIAEEDSEEIKFRCESVEYHNNGRVKKVTFR